MPSREYTWHCEIIWYCVWRDGAFEIETGSPVVAAFLSHKSVDHIMDSEDSVLSPALQTRRHKLCESILPRLS